MGSEVGIPSLLLGMNDRFWALRKKAFHDKVEKVSNPSPRPDPA
jgi:hypothetical protein